MSLPASTLTKSLIQARSAAEESSLVSNAKPSGRTSESSARSYSIASVSVRASLENGWRRRVSEKRLTSVSVFASR